MTVDSTAVLFEVLTLFAQGNCDLFWHDYWLTCSYPLQLDDQIQEVYKTEFGSPASAALLTHLKRELAHAIWKFLLDDDFIHAYVNGLVSKLKDGVDRLFFPRFMIYAMDYQEKWV